ncbi:MAG TPA: prephenate dehydrogenase [bacterium]|nr:prephenate dehydrogenase [bacterium]
MFRKAVIIGVGQMGASLGMNLVAKKLAKEVVGVGRNPRNLREAVRRHAIHRGVLVRAWRAMPLQRDDLIVLATPVRTIRDLLKRMPKGPLIVDVGSTKAAIVAEASKRRLRFVGCHPIAGTEIPGAKGAEKDLFRGKVCLMTPRGLSSKKDVALVRRLWTRLGASVEIMTPAAHDRLLASVSHLPHVLAYTLVNFVAGAPLAGLSKDLFAGLGSFRSATRVAASEPMMWRDILLENRNAVLSALEGWMKEVGALRRLIARRDAAGLARYLSRSQAERLRIP